jgi:FkbM family methyltransferase
MGIKPNRQAVKGQVKDCKVSNEITYVRSPEPWGSGHSARRVGSVDRLRRDHVGMHPATRMWDHAGMKTPLLREVARGILGVAGLLVPCDFARNMHAGRLKSVLLVLLDFRLRLFCRSFECASTVYGFQVRGNTRDFIQRRLYVFGYWERNLSHWFWENLREGDVFIDVGANIGYFSLLASQRVGASGRILAFEPVPSIASAMQINLNLNNVQNVAVHECIVSDMSGEGEVFRGPSTNLGGSSTQDSEGFESEGRVRKEPLDAIVDRELWPRVRAIKIDAEGDEYAVLLGASHLLPCLVAGAAVVVEVSPSRLKARGTDTAELMDYMRACGFVSYAVPNAYSVWSAAHLERATLRSLVGVPVDQQDVLFLKV